MANQYPVIAAGQRITTNLLNAMIPTVIRKPATTDRVNNTLADDPDLTAQLAANSVYLVEFHIKYSARVTTNVFKMQTAWTVPSGASGNRTAVGAGSSATDSSADNMSTRTGIHGYSTAITYGGRANTDNQLILIEESVVNTTSAGTCAIQWAQATTGANATSVYADSFMRIIQLA